MPRKRKPKQPEEPSSVSELLETGLVKPASEIDSPVADLPPPDKEIVPSGPKGPRRSDEPTALAEVLEQSPVARMVAAQEPPTLESFQANREAKSLIDPERDMPDPAPEENTSLEAEAPPGSQKPTHVQRLTGLRPAPKGFVGLEGHYAAGIRLTRSLDKNVVGIQFADDWRPSRDGFNPENEQLRDRGFSYRPERAQWERYDREQPGQNYQDAKEFVAGLAKDRRGEREADMGRS